MECLLSYIQHFEFQHWEEDQKWRIFPDSVYDLPTNLKIITAKYKSLVTSAFTFVIACSATAKQDHTKRMWVFHFNVWQHVFFKFCVTDESQLVNISEMDADHVPDTTKLNFYGGRWQSFFTFLPVVTEEGVTRQGSLL